MILYLNRILQHFLRTGTVSGSDKKLCIITGSKVNHLYSEEVCDVLKDKCKEVVVFSFPDGEKSKNLDTVKDIYDF